MVTLPNPNDPATDNVWGSIINTAISALDSALTSLSSTVSGLSSTVSTLTSTVGSLGTTVTALAGKVLPAAGVQGDLLVKSSGTDYAVAWVGGIQIFVQGSAPPAGSGQRVGDLWIQAVV